MASKATAERDVPAAAPVAPAPIAGTPAVMPAGVLTPARVIALQRTAGNAAVSRYLALAGAQAPAGNAATPPLARRSLARNGPPPSPSAPPAAPTAPPPTLGGDLARRVSFPKEGVYSGKKIATWGTHIDSTLTAKPRDTRNCATQEEATAWARSLGTSSAVFKEKVYIAPTAAGGMADPVDAYIVYPLDEDSIFSFSRDNTQLSSGGTTTNVTPAPGVPVLAIITTDGQTILPHMYKGEANLGTKMDQQDRPVGAGDPFGGHQEAHGPGLANLKTGDPKKDKDAFMRVFGLALEDTTLAVLATSEQKAMEKQGELAKGIPDADWTAIEENLPKLIAVDERLKKAHVRQNFAQRAENESLIVVDSLRKELAAAAADLDAITIERNEIVAKYPLLSQIDPVAFKAMPRDQRATALRGATTQVLADIATTRSNVRGGAVDPWELGPVVQATLSGLGIKDEQFRGWALEKAKWEKRKSAAFDIALGVLQIGLGIAALVFSGGLAGVALAAGALTVGVAGASKQTAEYFRDKAAANTDVDKSKALDPKDLTGQWAWVAIAWIGVGLDAGAVMSAAKQAAKAGWTLEKASAHLAEQLKRAPGDILALAQRALRPLTNEAARDVLMAAVRAEARESLKGVKVTVLPDKAFGARFASGSGEAVTVVTQNSKGATSIEVFVKETATPRGIADEAVHLEQSLEPELAKRMARIGAAEAGWSKLGLADQLRVYGDKLEVEADACRRAMKATQDTDELADYAGQLEDLEGRLKDVHAALAETDPGKMATKVPWWDPAQPALLFAKARTPLAEGVWVGKRGNGLWYSFKQSVIDIVGQNVGIPFRNNYPVFKKWAKATVKINFSESGHFAQADEAFAKQILREGRKSEFPDFFRVGDRELPPGGINKAAVERYREANALTWHHHQGEGEQMLLLAKALHNNVPHTGGHAISRGTHVP